MQKGKERNKEKGGTRSQLDTHVQLVRPNLPKVPRQVFPVQACLCFRSLKVAQRSGVYG